jgi:hypothetical protein
MTTEYLTTDDADALGIGGIIREIRAIRGSFREVSL